MAALAPSECTARCTRQQPGASHAVEHAHHHRVGAQALHERLAARPAVWELPHTPESNILCFRYRGSDEENQRLREAFNRSGQGWITTTVLGGRRVLRVTVMNPRTGAAELTRLVEGLEALRS